MYYRSVYYISLWKMYAHSFKLSRNCILLYMLWKEEINTFFRFFDVPLMWQMYDDTAEIRSMEWEWMDRKRRESSNSQGTLGAWDIKKTKKGYLFLPFITYIIIYNLVTIWNSSMQNKAVFYFHFDVFIFDNKVARGKMQLDGQFARCPAAVECPGL
jgi:hypothetical protein